MASNLNVSDIQPILMRLLRFCSKVLFVVSIIVFLVSTNVRWASSTLTSYNFLFDITKVESSSQISKDQLLRGAKQIIDYVHTETEPLAVIIEVEGIDQQVYSEREILHMKDVKDLFQNTYKIQEFSGGYLLLFSFALLYWRKAKALKTISTLAAIGASLAISFILLIVASSLLLSFQEVFNIFHYISFDNDLWILSPDTYLVRMYPYNFWLNATFLIGISTLVEGILILLISRFKTKRPH